MNKRNRVKVAIWLERADYGVDPPCPRCDVCGELTPEPDMHAFLIRRGHVPKRKQGCIWHKFNCVLLCRTCHEQADGMDDYFRDLQIMRYGAEAIVEWLNSLPLKVEVRL